MVLTRVIYIDTSEPFKTNLALESPVMQCINGVGSNPAEGRTDIFLAKEFNSNTVGLNVLTLISVEEGSVENHITSLTLISSFYVFV